MSRFIPIEKIRALREAAKQGDERAKKILRAQMDGVDYSADLDSFFAPKEEVKSDPVSVSSANPGSEPAPTTHTPINNPQLAEWLSSNGIKETDEDYEEALEEYYAEYPEQRPAQSEETVQQATQTQSVEEEIDLTKEIASSIFEAIKKCDDTNITLMQNAEIDPTKKKGAMTTIQEIKQSLTDSAEKLIKIKDSLIEKGGNPQDLPQ